MSEGSNTSYADEVFEEDVAELFPPSPPPLSEAAIRRHLAALVREEARIRQQFINTVVLSARANWVAAHSALRSLQTRAVADAAAADAQQAALAGGYNDARNTQLIRPLDAIVYHGMETYAAPRSPTRRKGHPIAALQGLLSTTSEAEASCSTRMVDYGHPREVLRAVSDCASLCGEAAATNNDNNNNDVSGSSGGLYAAASGDAFSNSVDSNNVANSGSTTSLTPFQRIKARAAVQLHERLLKQLQSASKHENRRQNIELKALHQTLPVGMSHAARIIALQKLKSNERRVTHLGPLTRGPYSSPTLSQEPTPSSSLPSQHPPNTIVDTINSVVLDKGHDDGGGSGVEDPDLEALPQHPKSTSASPSLAPSASHHSSSVSPAPRNRVTIASSTSSGTHHHHQHKKVMPRGSNNNNSNGIPTAKKTGRTPEEYLSPVHQAVLERYRRVRDETTETPTARLLNDPHYLFSTDAKKEMHDRTYLTATTAQKNKARAMKHEAIIAIKRYHDNHLRRQEAGLQD